MPRCALGLLLFDLDPSVGIICENPQHSYIFASVGPAPERARFIALPGSRENGTASILKTAFKTGQAAPKLQSTILEGIYYLGI